MRIGIEAAPCIRNADELHEALGLGPQGAAGEPGMQRQRLADLAADGEHGIEGARRSWKIMATRPPRTSSRRVGGAPISSSPASRTLPVTRALAGSRLRAASQVTDLPEPDSPTRPTASPGATERSMPRRAGTPAKLTWRSRMATRGPSPRARVVWMVDIAALCRSTRRSRPQEAAGPRPEGSAP